MKRKLTKVEKIGLVTLLLIAGFYFYLNQIYDPQMERFEQVSEEWRAIQQEIIDLGGRPPVVKGVERTVSDQRAELQELEQRLASVMAVKKVDRETVATETVARISDLALDNGLRIARLKVTPPGEGVAAVVGVPGAEHFTWWKCDLILYGNLRSLSSFVKSLLEMERLSAVRHLELTIDEEQVGYKITVNILI